MTVTRQNGIHMGYYKRGGDDTSSSRISLPHTIVDRTSDERAVPADPQVISFREPREKPDDWKVIFMRIYRRSLTQRQ